MKEELFEIIDNEKIGAMENIQDKVQSKLANIFSFYNEQEFLDEINGIETPIDIIDLNVKDQIE